MQIFPTKSPLNPQIIAVFAIFALQSTPDFPVIQAYYSEITDYRFQFLLQPSSGYAKLAGCRVPQFYVPRLILNVGTSRARHSQCHPRHCFTLTDEMFELYLRGFKRRMERQGVYSGEAIRTAIKRGKMSLEMAHFFTEYCLRNG